MKKTSVISVMLILVGFIFEGLYLTIDNLFLDTKFWLLGVICIVAGALGLWVSTVLPFINKNLGKGDTG